MIAAFLYMFGYSGASICIYFEHLRNLLGNPFMLTCARVVARVGAIMHFMLPRVAELGHSCHVGTTVVCYVVAVACVMD